MSSSVFLNNLPSPSDYRPFPEAALSGSIGAQFKAIAAAYPDQLAVSDRNQSLSYAQLAEQVRCAAGHLSLLLVQAPRPAGVALVFEPTVECAVAILAVLVSGHYFCPIGTDEPRERVRTYLKDAEIRLILTSRQLDTDLAELGTVPIQFVEDLLDDPRPTPPDPLILPGDLAALLYTSGSTGQPKAVIQTHEVLMQMIKNKGDAQRISTSERIVGLSTLAFGGFYWNLFAAFLYGGSLHFYDLKSETFAQLEDWLVETRISHIHCTPTTLRHLLDALKTPRAFPDLRLLSTGGEMLNPRDVRRFQEMVLGSTLLGTTGATVESCFYAYAFIACQSPLPADIDAIPMGYPGPAVEIQLWGSEETGDSEVVVFSPSLSPGYWQRPDLNAAKFGQDEAGRRCYRSGDLGKISHEGLLFHRGRRDFQVKIRGMRVEPGEIEQVLLDQAGVKEAAVIAGPGKGEDLTLNAFIVPTDPESTSPATIVAGLRQHLPSHMVPAGCAFLETLPLTRTGKVDRTALQALSTAPWGDGRAPVNPRDAVESAIFDIWVEVLEHDQFGIQDAFINVGGDSITAMKVRNRLEARFDLAFRSSSFFDVSTIGELATLVQSSATA